MFCPAVVEDKQIGFLSQSQTRGAQNLFAPFNQPFPLSILPGTIPELSDSPGPFPFNVFLTNGPRDPFRLLIPPERERRDGLTSPPFTFVCLSKSVDGVPKKLRASPNLLKGFCGVANICIFNQGLSVADIAEQSRGRN